MSGMVRQSASQPIAQEGLLESLSGRESLEGLLRLADGSSWRCRFQPAHVALLAHAWLHLVRVAGKVSPAAGNEIEVERIEILDPAVAARVSPSFWSSPTLEQLQREQGVETPSDADAIGRLWPADDDPEELLQFIRCEREIRRHDGDERRP